MAAADTYAIIREALVANGWPPGRRALDGGKRLPSLAALEGFVLEVGRDYQGDGEPRVKVDLEGSGGRLARRRDALEAIAAALSAIGLACEIREPRLNAGRRVVWVMGPMAPALAA